MSEELPGMPGRPRERIGEDSKTDDVPGSELSSPNQGE